MMVVRQVLSTKSRDANFVTSAEFGRESSMAFCVMALGLQLTSACSGVSTSSLQNLPRLQVGPILHRLFCARKYGAIESIAVASDSALQLAAARIGLNATRKEIASRRIEKPPLK